MTTEEQGNLFTQLSPYMNEYTILRIKELQLQNLPENKNTWQMQDELEVLKNNVVESIMDIIFDANKEVVEQKVGLIKDL